MPNGSMRVIAAMARKGGSGKTTLTRALISAAVAAGRRVTIVDADSTGVLSTWHHRAEARDYGSPLLHLVEVQIGWTAGRTGSELFKRLRVHRFLDRDTSPCPYTLLTRGLVALRNSFLLRVGAAFLRPGEEAFNQVADGTLRDAQQ